MSFEDGSPIIIDHQNYMIRRELWQCCVNCVNFQKDEVCLLFKQRPPASVIVTGCPKWEADIPF